MTELKTLLEVRNEIKERKPVFIRQDNPKRRKLNYKWRKPKGIHSKIRHKFKGRRKMPSPGYKSPIRVKGLHSTGLEMVNVSSINNLEKIKKETQGIIISKNVGMRKKLEILKKSKELDVKVLNLNVDEQIKKIEDIINSKNKVPKETKKEEVKKEKSKKETKEKEAKENIAEKQVEDYSKEAENKEKDKILTKKV
ncbi:MAG: 50S ribosomal protein L32e [Nanoarchaeota archaeon]|nr:50S ribosomal protein L32e [Nanoarchaeota archaeon]